MLKDADPNYFAGIYIVCGYTDLRYRFDVYIETAKANELNNYKYPELLLTEIPQHMNDKDLSFINDLLPWSAHAQKECPSEFKKS